ncbi:type II toxin-antitoxin system YhaV family toxin [Rouxiella sp. T17]|uniref:type II toxin-antitoxin system YhaV family toxin n=1 Tax=Rouxiella sp. T17 TaxID=3085684 RepID=UPI002FCAC860
MSSNTFMTSNADAQQTHSNHAILQNAMTINSWTFFHHPCFDAQFTALIDKVEALRLKHPESFQNKRASKVLYAIHKVITERIAVNPAAADFMQGKTLGKGHQHGCRAKFLQQYRLFFRFDRQAKIVILAWVNDDKTLRAYDQKSDAYADFGSMLKNGNPPDDWRELLQQAT